MRSSLRLPSACWGSFIVVCAGKTIMKKHPRSQTIFIGSQGWKKRTSRSVSDWAGSYRGPHGRMEDDAVPYGAEQAHLSMIGEITDA